MTDDGVGFGFPFAVAPSGRIEVTEGDDTIRGKIVQVLFTSPGERVNRQDFGCGLFKLVFEPNDDVLAAAVEFTVGQALTRWLGDEIVVDGVDVDTNGELVDVEIVWANKADLSRQAVHIQFR
jgi:phage baseplate assembly protein W